MKNFKAITGILLVFILGAVSGAIVSHMVDRERHEAFVKGGYVAREDVIVKRLTKQLDLDQQQQLQIKALVHESRSAIQEVRKQALPQIEQLLDQAQKRISAVLRPEQQEKYLKLIAERKERRQKKMQ